MKPNPRMHYHMTPEALVFFKDKCADEPNENGCIEWIGGKFPTGYGAFTFKDAHGNKVTTRSSRLALFLSGVRYTEEKPICCHKCTNKACVNPDHLYAGSYQDNMDDRDKDGNNKKGEESWSANNKHRLARGDANGSRTKPENLRRGEQQSKAKLTNALVLKIRDEYGPKTLQQLSKETGVHLATVSRVVLRQTWKHIP